MQIFKTENKNRKKLTVILEPWAEEYYLKKNDTLEFRQDDGLKGYYHQCIYQDGDIQIFVEGEYTYPDVFINGTEVASFNE